MYTPSQTKGDVWGFFDLPRVIQEYRPDLIYSSCDPGTFVMAAQVIPEGEKFLGYLPVEGEPIANTSWRNAMSNLPFFTCSEFGVKVVKESLGKDVDYVYYGVDHDVFNTKPRELGERDKIREIMHWDDKFVVMAVSTNVHRKQLPRLIEAISILRYQYNQKDIVLYLHTVPFQHYWLDGWNLMEVTSMFGVADRVMFHPAMNKFNAAIPELSEDLSNPGLVQLYNSADLFVNVSQVEGFGLPTAEAMACGVPVAVTKYAAGYEIVRPAGKGIQPHDWEVHKSSTRYANLDPKDIAKTILELKRNPRERDRMSKIGLERVKDFTWDAVREKVILESEKVLNGDQGGNTSTQEADTLEEAGTQEERI